MQGHVRGKINVRKDPRCKYFSHMTLALVLLAPALPALARESASLALDKWRPKDGIYAETGKRFQESCGETDGITIELRDRSVNGYEWGCDVTNVADLDPDSIKVEMTCHDYNLAQNLNPRDPNWENRVFKEILLIRRLDAKTLSIQKTLNGKFKDPAWKVAYCPKSTQRNYAEAKLKAKEEAKEKARQKAEEERGRRSASPRDGVYAAAGADFEDRCGKGSDTVVSLARNVVVTASNRCEIDHIRVQLPDTVRLGAACTPQPSPGAGAQPVSIAPSADENLMFKKIDDKTVILWIIDNGHFTGEGLKLSYCSEKVQRAYASQLRADKPVKGQRPRGLWDGVPLPGSEASK